MSKLSNENLIAQATSIETVPSATQEHPQPKVLGLSLGAWIFIVAALLVISAGLMPVVDAVTTLRLEREKRKADENLK